MPPISMHPSKRFPFVRLSYGFEPKPKAETEFDEKTDLTTPPNIHASSVTSSRIPKDKASKKGREETKYMDKPLGNVVEVFSSEFQ